MCDAVQSLKVDLLDIENESLHEERSSDYEELMVLEPAKPCITDIPVEIFLNICSFLEPMFLKNTLTKVCKRFEDILSDEHYWKHWIHSRIHGCYPPLLDLELWDREPIPWEEVSVEMDKESRKWQNADQNLNHIVVKDVHFASVDTVLLVNNGELCISGGRDRGMALWNVSDVKSHEKAQTHTNTSTVQDLKPMKIQHDAHAGWVWDLAPDYINSATTIYSASWDNTVKAWDLETGFKCKEIFQCGMSALSVVASGSTVTAGLYSKKILTFDMRRGTTPTQQYKAHKGPILALHTFSNNLIASISEDKTIAIWDRIAGKLLRSFIRIPCDKALPICINWTPMAMYVGDSKGYVHLYNPECFTYQKTHQVWPEPDPTKASYKITSCYQGNGNMILCSDRGEIKFLYGCYPPHEYATVKTSTLDVTQLRYLNDVMVVGTCDSALEFWIPNEECDKVE